MIKILFLWIEYFKFEKQKKMLNPVLVPLGQD
jgi:hypothetical protein